VMAVSDSTITPIHSAGSAPRPLMRRMVRIPGESVSDVHEMCERCVTLRFGRVCISHPRAIRRVHCVFLQIARLYSRLEAFAVP
jgi:hypothetical protein